MCKRAVLTNRPLLELSPLRPKAREPARERGTAPVSSSTRTVARASSPNRARKGVDDGTKQPGCRGRGCSEGQGGCVHSHACITSDLPEFDTGTTSIGRLVAQAQGDQGRDGGKRRLREGMGQDAASRGSRGANRGSQAGS